MDEPLIRRAMHGDALAFDALGRARIDRLYAVAYRVLRDAHDADDAVQDALWTAWRELPGLREPERFEAWLYRILVNACYRLGRRDRRFGTVLRLVPELDPAGGADGASEVAERDEMEWAFRSLTTEQRAVVVLHYYVGLPLTEIADVLGVPAGTARSRLHYAHSRLRETLGGERPVRAAGAGS